MNRVHKSAVILVIAVVIAAVLVWQLALARANLRTARNDLNRARAEIQQINLENRGLAEKLASARLPESRPANELLKLRGEVTRLREAEREIGPREAVLKEWANKIVALKQAQERMPDKFIPELQLATEKDWADAVWGLDLSTEDGIREALSKLRDSSVNLFFNEVLRPALKRYLQAHDGVLPADLAEVKGFLGGSAPALDEDVFRRYRLLQSGRLSSDPSQPILELAVHVDPDYDSNHQMGINGASGGRYNHVQSAVDMAAEAFASQNNGAVPSSAAEIRPYLKGSFEPRAVDHYLSMIAQEKAR